MHLACYHPTFARGHDKLFLASGRAVSSRGMPVPARSFETTASGGDLAEADRRLSGEPSSDDAASPGGTMDGTTDYNSVCIGAGHAQPAARRKSSGKFQLFSRGSKSPTSPQDPELLSGGSMLPS